MPSIKTENIQTSSRTSTPSPLRLIDMDDYDFSWTEETPPEDTENIPTPALSNLILSFIQTLETSPVESKSTRSHAHTSLPNTYIISRAFQSFLTSPRKPLTQAQQVRRLAGLRILAQRLHLLPDQKSSTQDALQALDLLDSYVRDSLKAEMAHVASVVPKSKWFPATKEEERFLGDLGKLRYRAGVALEALSRRVRKEILKGDLEGDGGEEGVGLAIEDLAVFLDGKGKEKVVQQVCVAGLSKEGIAAFQAVEGFQYTVNVCAEELLRVINDGTVRGHVGKMLMMQDAFEKMGLKLDELVREEGGNGDVD